MFNLTLQTSHRLQRHASRSARPFSFSPRLPPPPVGSFHNTDLTLSLPGFKTLRSLLIIYYSYSLTFIQVLGGRPCAGCLACTGSRGAGLRDGGAAMWGTAGSRSWGWRSWDASRGQPDSGAGASPPRPHHAGVLSLPLSSGPGADVPHPHPSCHIALPGLTHPPLAHHPVPPSPVSGSPQEPPCLQQPIGSCDLN